MICLCSSCSDGFILGHDSVVYRGRLDVTARFGGISMMSGCKCNSSCSDGFIMMQPVDAVASLCFLDVIAVVEMEMAVVE